MMQLHCDFGDFQPFLQKSEQFETAMMELPEYHQKQSCWIWFLLPNLKRDGLSYYSDYFGLYNQDEAILFYQNDILKKRLFLLLEIINENQKKYSSKYVMNGYSDMMKLKSCIKLFYSIAMEEKEKQLLSEIKIHLTKDYDILSIL
jgi:uncharacterized protein (DUF1810 family)